MMRQNAINGARYISGSFTVPSTGSTYQLEFGQTFSNYLFRMELDDASKQTLVNSGVQRARAFGAFGQYPKFQINGKWISNAGFSALYTPSADSVSVRTDPAWTMSDSSIIMNTADIDGSGSTAFYHGLTYNYYIVEII